MAEVRTLQGLGSLVILGASFSLHCSIEAWFNLK